jgi:FAD/FMN-containing dehydrogenase
VKVNDVHSQLNETRVERIVRPATTAAVAEVVRAARQDGQVLCVCGGRHAMGGQQFREGATLVDISRLNRLLHLDEERGTVVAEAGIQWPELVRGLLSAQARKRSQRQWGIAQKQTGADRLSLGGALASNIHGRGLRMKPIIGDVEAFTLVDAAGEVRRCSREEEPDRFGLVIGGYGLFGIITTVTLRLAPRRKVERVVRILDVSELMPAFEERIAAGFLYGDFQYMTDERAPGFLRTGVFSCYRPVDPATPVPAKQRQVSERQWRDLVYLAHVDKARAFQLYADFYRASAGQIYWSDTHQLAAYLDNYHHGLDGRLGHRGSEMIAELNVPRTALPEFLAEAREDLRRGGVSVIYGTIRLVEADAESFLAWAKQPYACVIFNLHVEHTPAGVEQAAAAFRRLNDMAIRRGGSFYLTYHRYATRDQVAAAYPQFAEFLRRKRCHDPEERFQSDWYCHYRSLFQAG